MKRCETCKGKGIMWDELFSYDANCDSCTGTGLIPQSIEDLQKHNKLKEEVIRDQEYDLGIGKHIKVATMVGVKVQAVGEDEDFKVQEPKIITLRVYDKPKKPWYKFW